MTPRARLAWLAGLLSLAPAPARADAAADAQALFDQGRALMNDGKFAEACPKLAESQRIDPGGGTLLHLALCHESLGKTATARAELADAITAAVAAHRADRERIARNHLVLLTPRLSPVTIVVPPSVRELPDLAVKDDGVAVARAAWGVPTPRDPGAHVLEVSAPGKVSFSTTFTVAEGAAVTVSVPPLEDSRSSRRAIGLGLAGAGLVGVVIGIGAGVDAIAKKSASGPECPAGNLCTRQGVALRAQGLTAGNVSTAALVVGGAAVVAGVLVVALGPAASKPRVAVGAAVGPGMAGASLRGGLVSARGMAALVLALALLPAWLLACNALIGLQPGEPGCGNGEIDPGEECDEGLDAGPTCVDCKVRCLVGSAFKDPTTLHCYALAPEAGTLSWIDGLAACRALGDGYDMAGITSTEQVAFLGPQLPPGFTWVGGTDVVSIDDAGTLHTGAYGWIGGEPWWPGLPWQPGDPADAGAVRCVAGQVGPGMVLRFVDSSCSDTYPVLCER